MQPTRRRIGPIEHALYDFRGQSVRSVPMHHVTLTLCGQRLVWARWYAGSGALQLSLNWPRWRRA